MRSAAFELLAAPAFATRQAKAALGPFPDERRGDLEALVDFAADRAS